MLKGYLIPEGFTDGGIQQRVRWFAGLKSQDLNHAIRFPRERCSEIFRMFDFHPSNLLSFS